MTFKLFIERQKIARRLKHIIRLEHLRDDESYGWRPYERDYLEHEIKTRYKNLTLF